MVQVPHRRPYRIGTKTYPVRPPILQVADICGRAAYAALVAKANADHSAYWARLARGFIIWQSQFNRSLDADNAPFSIWFEEVTLHFS